MTVALQTPYSIATGNGVTTVFPYQFLLLDEEDLAVYVDGVLQTLNVNYSVSGVGNLSGGNVTFLTGAPANDATVSIKRAMRVERTTDYQNAGDFKANVVNPDFDRAILLIQDLQTELGRALRLPEDEVGTLPTMPALLDRIGKYIAFDALGLPIASVGTGNDTALRSDLASTVVSGEGARLVGVRRPETGSVARRVDQRLAEISVSVADFGAVGDGVTDDSAAINKALATGKNVEIPVGMNCLATQLSMAVAGTTLTIRGTLTQSVWNNTLINISANYCTVQGPGRIVNPATWDGTNAPRTYAVFWITGHNPTIRDIQVTNVPRCCIRMENATNWKVQGVVADGNYPQASYTGVETGHMFLDIDTPPIATFGDDLAGVCSGNIVKEFIEGVFIGNLGANGNAAGVNVSGNTFTRCWDHGIYTSIARGVVVTGNTFNSCKQAVKVDGIGPVVSGNAIYSPETVNTNGYSGIDLRESNGAVIVGNFIYGLGAAIDASCNTDPLADVISNATISHNVIYRTGAGQSQSAIRLGAFADTCENCIIEGNIIYGGNYSATVGVIQLEMNPTKKGRNNVVRGNLIRSTGVSNGIMVNSHDAVRVENNHIEFEGNAGAGITVRAFYIIDCLQAEINNNTVIYETNGTNVTIRGGQISGTSTGSRFTNNRFRLTSGSLAGAAALDFVGAYFQTGNVVNGGTALATNATENFLYVPTCAGPPTGAATAYAGLAPIVVDSTNNKLYFRSGGAWRDAGP